MDFLPQRGNYRNLIVYQKSEAIYDMTYHFAHRFLQKGDRTIDQMIQAARSGKQNIAEGSAASTTSKETEIRLINVAKASLQELLVDYEDYLRVRNLPVWGVEEERSKKLKKVCRRHNEVEFYTAKIEERSDEAIANIVITLIHQTDLMLLRYIERCKKDFLEKGGIREEMSRARIDYRNRQQGKKG